MKTAHEAPLGRVPLALTPSPLRRAPRFVAASLLAALALGAALPGCDEASSDTRQLQASRVYEPIGRRIRWGTPAAERHGISARDFAGGSMGGAAAGGAGSMGDDAGVAGLHWSTPTGWKERPAAMFRDANFFVAGDERAECYLTTLGGDAGGLEANINRWRTQLSLPPLGAAEIAALPRLPWLGGSAASVDFSGHWQGMSGDQAEPDYRLVGLALVQPDSSRFLKMVGPADVIGRELAAFAGLAASFHDGSGHEHAATPASAPQPMPMPPQGLPPDHPPIGAVQQAGAPTGTPGAAAGGAAAGGATAAAAAGADVQGNASLTWRTPAGWTRGPDKSMREVTYFAGAGNAVECYVTLLGGSGGGLLANINRWCGQLGAPALTEADLVPLQRVSMAGTEGVIVRLERGPGATAPAGQDLLLGALCMLPDRALFVKLTGPADAVQAQRDALVQFAQSLQVVR